MTTATRAPERAQPTAKLKVEVVTHHRTSHDIPKLVELLDAKLKKIRSEWFVGRTIQLDDIEPGYYIVRLSLTSTVNKDEVVEIKKGKNESVTLDISGFSNMEVNEWAYFSKSFLLRDWGTQTRGGVRDVRLGLWSMSDGRWNYSYLPQSQLRLPLDKNGETVEIPTGNGMHILEVTARNMPKRSVCLPAGQPVLALIRLSEGPRDVVHPLEIVVSTRNWNCEALLSLITAGSINEARKLYNTKEAAIIQEVEKSATAAAIVGYFFLKIGTLGYLVDGARFMADNYPWMPDGCVIHAWQFMQQEEQSAADIALITNRLVEAVGRGVPFYTEGLRLLYDGLVKLSYFYNKRNTRVQRALAIVEKYVSGTDWSNDSTTFSVDTLDDHNMTPPRERFGGTRGRGGGAQRVEETAREREARQRREVELTQFAKESANQKLMERNA